MVLNTPNMEAEIRAERKAFNLACELLYEAIGECPMYMDDYLVESICVEDKCSMNDDSKPIGCWKRYLIERAKYEENEKA